MASTSSREAALERRRALTNGGKKAEGRFSSAPIRVRSAADARPARTEVTTASASAPAPTPVPASAPPQRSVRFSDSTPPVSRRSTRAVSNPSRDLVLARREALSQRGKRASTSKDRTRTDLARVAPAQAAPAATTKAPCKCQDGTASRTSTSESPALSLNNGGSRNSLGGGSANRANTERRTSSKRAGSTNPSRALVLARREALSKRGKSANTSTSTTAASVARQVNPDLTSRELAQKVRELKCKVGSAGTPRHGGSRPTGPNRNGAKQAALADSAAADAHWKVGLTQTSRGQIVTGTQANRSLSTTGNEAGTCRVVTGTEYLGSEVFNTFCQTGPLGTQPAKVAVTATSHGNRVTGNQVGRSEKVTGDEPGTCKNVTGTEYLSANQSQAYCGVNPSTPRKVGRTTTVAGQAVSGVMVGRSEKVTGNEPGSGRQLTGDQYVTEQHEVVGRSPQKVGAFQTLRGTGITGTTVGRSGRVTGDEPGSCRSITGDEYIGSEQYESFCGVRPAPEAAKVGFSVTPRSQVVSGTRTGRSEKVTGDEPGTCKIVTGTPYAGMEEAGNWCSTGDVQRIRQRTPVRMGTVMSGIQPGIGGVMTGAERGACEAISGTPYVGPDQMAAACGTAAPVPVDFPQPLTTAPWQDFSVQSPSRIAQIERETTGAVTGSTYEHGGRITGPFDMAAGKVTGTEQFRFDRRSRDQARGPLTPVAPAEATKSENAAAERPKSRVTGEGLTGGLTITGDDWNRGKHVTGTEGPSARRRNPSRPGPGSAMPAFQAKRNEALPEPVSRITGSSGNTMSGSLITVSGGARG
ncbi:MAG: CsoS2 family carboxysome shell protein [Cyanobacteriota bacterium]|nr:CsoS2 family carboxysome shell protein [Cyanobacteriota bacterium]